MELNREQAIDILERFAFFQGQRAGRELWNDKPFDVQEQDIANFSRDVASLKIYIKELTEENKAQKGLNTMIGNELRRLGEENERLTEELAKSYKALDEQMNFYCSFTKSKVSDCPINDEIAKAKADTVRKMAERLKQILREEGRSGHYIKATIDQVAKEFDPHWMDQDGK